MRPAGNVSPDSTTSGIPTSFTRGSSFATAPSCLCPSSILYRRAHAHIRPSRQPRRLIHGYLRSDHARGSHRRAHPNVQAMHSRRVHHHHIPRSIPTTRRDRHRGNRRLHRIRMGCHPRRSRRRRPSRYVLVNQAIGGKLGK